MRGNKTKRCGQALAAAVLSAGAVAAVASPAFAVTSITSCNQTVTTSAKLAASLVCAQPATGALNGIVAGADNITIDLAGHTITAPAAFNGGLPRGTQNGVGVLDLGHNGITIRNGKLSGWTTGVLVRAIESATAPQPATNNVITSMTILDCGTTGASRRGLDVAEPGANDNQVTNNTVSGTHCTAGIRLHEAEGNTVTGNSVKVGTAGVGDGLVFDCGSGNSVVKNTLSGNGRYGILDGQSPSNTIASNTIGGNASGGIFFGPPISNECPTQTPSDNTLISNTINTNGGNGIKIGLASTPTATTAFATGNLLRSNSVGQNTLWGIDFEDGGNTVTFSTLTGNGSGGIVVPSNGNSVLHSKALGNHGDGIRITGTGNTFQANLATLNTGVGIAVGPGNIDGGGNVGAGNGGSALDCTFGLACSF